MWIIFQNLDNEINTAYLARRYFYCIFPSSVGERENVSNGRNVSSLSEFRFTTTLLVIPMDMDGLHWNN